MKALKTGRKKALDFKLRSINFSYTLKEVYLPISCGSLDIHSIAASVEEAKLLKVILDKYLNNIS